VRAICAKCVEPITFLADAGRFLRILAENRFGTA